MQAFPFDSSGILLRRDAVAAGFDDNCLRRAVRNEELEHIRHGAYADRAVWQAASRAGRHVLLTRAVMRQYDDRVALSHASAHLFRGGPDHGLDLTRVNLTSLFGRGDRTQAGITHHQGRVLVGDVTRTEGHWITVPARTAVDTAASAELVPAVCVLDWTLHEGLATRDQLLAYAEVHMREWPGTVGLPVAVRRCDGRSESVGESWARLILEDAGFDPEPQFAVHDAAGRVVGRVDFLLRRLGLLVEFDGAIKYGRLLKRGQSLHDVINAERARERLVQELTGLWMMRLVWDDLLHPGRTTERVRRVVSQRAKARDRDRGRAS
jgi:hypothetical protein